MLKNNQLTTGNLIADTALDVFGEANSSKTAGYIVPDGRFLDFSGSANASPGSRQVFGSRALDHRTLFDVVERHPELSSDSQTKTMLSFMEKAETIRFGEYAHHVQAHWIVCPTVSQFRAIMDVVKFNDIPLLVTIGKRNGDVIAEKEFTSGTFNWEDLKEFDRCSRRNINIDAVLGKLSASLDREDDDSPESGECAEFALALCSVLGLDETPEEKVVSFCIREVYDAEGEFLMEGLSHWVVNVNNESYDWRGAGADIRWEDRWDPEIFTDEDGETSAFRWETVPLEQLVQEHRKWTGTNISWEAVHKWEDKIVNLMNDELAMQPSQPIMSTECQI